MGVLKRQHNRNVIIPQFYNASDIWQAKTVSVAGDRLIVLSPLAGELDIGDKGFYWDSQVGIDVSIAANWDTTTPTNYTTAANRIGKDFCIYACRAISGSGPKFLLSANTTYPSGYDSDNSRKVGGFHCIPGNINHNSTLSAWSADTAVVAGQSIKASSWDTFVYECTIAGTTHASTEPNWSSISEDQTIADGTATWKKVKVAYEGYVAGDIMPHSVWCIKRRPTCSPSGMIRDPKTCIWIDIYPQSGTGANTVSAYNGTITHSRMAVDHDYDQYSVGKRLLFIQEFRYAARGSNKYALAGGSDPTNATLTLDVYGRSMISNVGCIQMLGAHWTILADMASALLRYRAGGYYGGTYMTGYQLNSLDEDSDTSPAYTSRGACEPKVHGDF